jgi:hypothetical protein
LNVDYVVMRAKNGVAAYNQYPFDDLYY